MSSLCLMVCHQFTLSIALALTIQFTTVDYHRAKWTFFSHNNILKTRLNNSVSCGILGLRVSEGLNPSRPEEIQDALD